MHCRIYPLLLLALILNFYHVQSQPSLPDGFVPEVVFSGIDCISMTFAPGEMIFVTEKSGNIYLVQQGNLILEPILSIPVDNREERGLLGITVDPEFEYNNYVYVYYTVPNVGHNRLSRFKFHDDHLHLEEEEVLMNFDIMDALVHNGGDIKFGSDGKLYIATGDGHAPYKAQSHSSLLGKILRINPDGSIPTDNPFYFQNTGIYKSIYAIGFRNPFTFSFNKEGLLFVNDVGEGRYEEVNNVLPGGNYGWPIMEGMLSENSSVTPPDGYIDPFHVYSHETGCAIVGSAFYSSEVEAFPEDYVNKYFFADFCNYNIYSLDTETGEVSTFIKSDLAPVFIAVSNMGELYYMTFNYIASGTLWKVTYSTDGTPKITSQPDPVICTVGESIEFIIKAIGEEPLSYQWLRNGVEIPDENNSTLLLENVDITNNGDIFECHVSNTRGSVTSEFVSLTVTYRQRPIITFLTSHNQGFYVAGDTIIVRAEAVDSEEGVLPKSSMEWTANFHHDFHYHPVFSRTADIDSIGFRVSRVGETSPNVWFRIHVKATNSIGLTRSAFTDVLPRTSTITFDSNLESPVTISLDGIPRSTPQSFIAVTGMTRTLSAPTYLYQDEQLYAFETWNYVSSEKSLTFDVPNHDTTFVAHYAEKSWGDGDGLSGLYYNNWDNMEGSADLERTDGPLDFDWQSQTPADVITSSNYGVIWKGYINIPVDANYLFYILADGGASMTIADTLIINEMQNNSLNQFEGKLYLKGGTRYPITITFRNHSQGRIKLLWSIKDVFPALLVPLEALYGISHKTTVTINNLAPSSFVLGSTLHLNGKAVDFQGVTIPEENFTWSVHLVDTDKVLVLMTSQGSTDLSYSIPHNLPYSDKPHLLIKLEVKDNNGFYGTAIKQIEPKLSTVQVISEVVSIPFNINGQSFTSPQNITVIQGEKLMLQITDTLFIREGVLYLYSNWSESNSISLHISSDTTISLDYLTILLNNGTGLIGRYYSGNKDFGDNPDSVAIDSQLNAIFSDLEGPLKADWSGFIIPPEDGNYVLMLSTTDKGELRFSDNTYKIDKGSISTDVVHLKDEMLYPLEVRYETQNSHGSITLTWSSEKLPKHVVPMLQLFPELITGEKSNFSDLKIYPNPTSNFIKIDIPENLNYSEFVISDPLGQILYASKIGEHKGHQLTINMRSFANGLYYLKVFANKTLEIFKIIKYSQ